MGQTLANHSYVNFSLVRRPYYDGEGVRCITDLSTCCTSEDGAHHGDWYFPDGTRLSFNGDNVDIYEFRGGQRVNLRRRNNANSPTGIYCCDIPTMMIITSETQSMWDCILAVEVCSLLRNAQWCSHEKTKL